MAARKRRRKPDKSAIIGPPITATPADECSSLSNVFASMQAFGGGGVGKAYRILHEVIQKNIPLVVAIAGPITLSDQHHAWLIPLIKRGWIAYLTVTDAICYHDGHDCLQAFNQRPIGQVDLYGDDSAYRDAGIVRVADTGFHESILYKQDAIISTILQFPEFQKRMTTTERNYMLGGHYSLLEETNSVSPGLLSTCFKLDIPVFVGAAADGSVFLNSVKLWAEGEISGDMHRFEYDLHKDVFEACAYHYWGLHHSNAKSLAILILGGGVPKNYSLQPEPMLSQIFGLSNIRGYDYDVQIVSSPVTDGSLSSCFPQEAVTWGKINPETCQQNTVSIQADYSTIMPFISWALLQDNSLRACEHLRLFRQRDKLTQQLLAVVGDYSIKKYRKP